MNKVRLGDVCDILNGYAFRSENYVDEGIRIIRIANVQKGYIEDKEPQYYPFESEEDISKYYLQENDLLISLTGNVGRVALLPKEMLPAALNQRVACLRMKDDSCISKDYLFHLLDSDDFENQCIRSAKGVAQKNMSTKWLMEYEIPIFDNVTQTHLISIFGIIDQLMSNHQSVLTKLDELIKSRFVEMFDSLNNYTAFSDLCTIITDGTHQPPKFVEEGIPFLFVSNIVTNSINYEAEKFISEDTYNELYKRTPIEIGDIIMSTVGSYGHPAVVTSNKKFLFQRHIAYLKPKKEIINPLFLHSAILSEKVQEQIERRVKGIAQKTLNLSEIKQLRIPLPDLHIQNQFADFVTQVDKTKSGVKQSIEKLETLKKSLMQEYFG